jgi:hypothetical protein
MSESELRTALEGLGATSAGVAAALREAGIKGLLCHGFDCPVARWLARAFPGHRFAVDREGVDICHAVAAGVIGRVVLPRPVSRFVGDFDHKGYPELIEYRA